MRRRLLVAVIAGSLVLVPASAHADHGLLVAECNDDPGALASALVDASDGDVIEVEGRCVGTFVLDKDVTIVGKRDAVLDGDGNGPVVSVPAGVTAIIKNTRITGGHGTGPFAVGGVFNEGNLSLIRSRVHGNSAMATGELPPGTGAINTAVAGISSIGGNLILDRTTVSHNESVGVVTEPSDPSSVFSESVSGVYSVFGSVTIEKSTIRNNEASIESEGVDFGRVLAYTVATTFSDVRIDRTTVRNNSAEAYSAGVFEIAYANGGIDHLSGTVVITRSLIRRNRSLGRGEPAPIPDVPGALFAPGITVGGVYCEHLPGDSPCIISGTTVRDNSASGNGLATGGIDLHRGQGGGEWQISDSVVRGNKADATAVPGALTTAIGGIRHSASYGASLALTGTQLIGNEALGGTLLTVGGLGVDADLGAPATGETVLIDTAVRNNTPTNCNIAEPGCAPPNSP